MPDDAPPIRIVLTTCSSPGDASKLGRTLVEEHLAACATLIPAVQSIYHWQGAVESAAEVLLLIKTSSARNQEVQSTVASLHSYEVPEFLVLPVLGGSNAYLAWLGASLD